MPPAGTRAASSVCSGTANVCSANTRMDCRPLLGFHIVFLALLPLSCASGSEPTTWAVDASDASLPADAPSSESSTFSSDGISGAPAINDADVARDAANAADVGSVDGSDAGSVDGSDAALVDCTARGGVVSWANGSVRVDYDMSRGTATFLYGGIPRVSSFYAGVALGSYTTTTMYKTRTCVVRGNEAVVTNTDSTLPTIEQHFALSGGNKFLVRAIVLGSAVGTNWISPVVMDTVGGVDVGSQGDVRVLSIPYDNDAWVSYDAQPIAGSGTSYEAAAFYDNVTRNGIVVGSVTHDTWKTGVYYSGASGKLDALHVFGGAVDATSTHDVVPHGKVGGSSIASPIVFVGYAPDWRDLMEEFADTNLSYKPQLAWSGGAPFGWNSWGTLQTQVTYDAAVGISDFVHDSLQNAGFADDGVVYVNLDSYWDNLSDAQLDAFVAHCHANGQRAGIYWTPFVDWGKSATRQVEGTSYAYSEVWLRDASGSPIALDGAYAIDPTHPGTKGRIDTFLAAFKRHGFEYIKLDFLSHGALESAVRFDPSVQTGVQAYNQGMQYLVDRIGGTMFISESIAPLFPHGYAHGRRISCDVSGAAVGPRSAEYEMNSASYGWWMSGRLYRFNDPYAIVLEGFTANDNMTRLLSAVVSGTIFLDGDDLTRAPAQALARTYLTNDRIDSVARLGKAFRPVEANTGTAPSDVLVLADGGTYYVAVFNFGSTAADKTVDLARAGLDATAEYAVTDLWTGAATTAQGTLTVTLEPGFARLFALR